VPDTPNDPNTFQLPAYLEHDLPAIPDLDDPKAYTLWRIECVEVRRIPRAIIAEVLESIGSDIAYFRAAVNLSNHPQHREWQKQLMVKAFAGRREVYLLTKCLEAHMIAQQGHGIELQFDILASSMAGVIQNVLKEVAATQQRTPLHLELEARAHIALSEAMCMIENYDDALAHAAEVILLAPLVGLDNFIMNSKYLIADIQFRRGNVQIAQRLMDEVIGSPNSPLILVEAAQSYRAEFQFWIGDESASQSTMSASEPDLRKHCWWLETFTLRHANPQQDCLNELESENGLAHALIIFFDTITEAQTLSPERDEQIQILYRNAARALRQMRSVFSKGWFIPYGRALEAYAMLRSKPLDILDALTALPSLQTQTMPAAARAFTAATAIEVSLSCLLKLIPDHPNSSAIVSLDLALSDLKATLASVEDSICEQITRKLQLLCPTALALAAVCSDAPQMVRGLGTDAIMNLHQRPITVYGSPGLRPIHAARITLEAFGRNDLLTFSRGGGQVREMRSVLYRRYFERSCWYTPVSPAVLIGALLLLRDCEHIDLKKNQIYQKAATATALHFGITPRIQQTEKIQLLEQLEEVLHRGLNHRIDREKLKQVLSE
jgi:tetratricopeptide (TPR) repeat protein